MTARILAIASIASIASDALPMVLGFAALFAPFGALYYMLAICHAAARAYGSP